MSAYYNENDPFAAEWLRELIKAGHIAPGDVDDRSIVDVTPVDLKPYDQCHFFAGIGGWSLALRQARWPDNKPVWTGSCPCQPFSAAGKRTGAGDDRDLWWAFFWLISQCQPEAVFGEQVASKDGLAWWDTVQTDLEGAGYTATAFDLCAAGIGAPHIRQRLFWVGALVNANDARQRKQRWVGAIQEANNSVKCSSQTSELAHADQQQQHGVGNAGPKGRGEFADDCGASWPGPVNGVWRDADWLFCRDGKWRPVEPGTFPLAHGATSRVGRLRGYGNAIVAPLAQAFIEAYQEVIC